MFCRVTRRHRVMRIRKYEGKPQAGADASVELMSRRNASRSTDGVCISMSAGMTGLIGSAKGVISA